MTYSVTSSVYFLKPVFPLLMTREKKCSMPVWVMLACFQDSHFFVFEVEGKPQEGADDVK